MHPKRTLVGRIGTTIRQYVTRSAEDNPDGVIALYLWLWKSIGGRPRRTPILRFIRFFSCYRSISSPFANGMSALEFFSRR